MADGRIIIDVKANTKGIDDAEKAIDQLEQSGQDTAESITSSFTNMGKAITTVLASKVVFDFGKQATQAAATAEAMQAQFEQVFDNVKDSASDSLNAIAKETGVLPNRLKPAFTQMAAFAKTTGMDTEDALSLTERATLAAADSAAFYDKSIESVTESLQSYLKGNYANDAALGISSTETTRNAKANELYGQSFIDLSEAQKQLTLLAMVEDGNKLSGALGQAARESDGLENVMGNLKQSWQDFLAVVGQPILEAVIPILQGVTTAIQELPQFINGVVEGYKAWSAEHPLLMQFLTGATAALGAVAIGFGLYTAATTLASVATTAFTAIMAVLTSPITLVIAAVAALAGAIYMIYENWGAIGPWLSTLWEGIKSYLSETLGSIVTTIQTKFSEGYNAVVEWFGKIPGEIQSIWEEAVTYLTSIDLAQAGKDIIQGLIDGIASMATSLFNKAGELASGVWGKFQDIFSFGSPSKKMFQAGVWIDEGAINGIKSKMGELKATAMKAAEAMDPRSYLEDATSTALNGMPTNLGATKFGMFVQHSLNIPDKVELALPKSSEINLSAIVPNVALPNINLYAATGGYEYAHRVNAANAPSKGKPKDEEAFRNRVTRVLEDIANINDRGFNKRMIADAYLDSRNVSKELDGPLRDLQKTNESMDKLRRGEW